jgi:hypothetical protein
MDSLGHIGPNLDHLFGRMLFRCADDSQGQDGCDRVIVTGPNVHLALQNALGHDGYFLYRLPSAAILSTPTSSNRQRDATGADGGQWRGGSRLT